jgi:hypothetical protein
VSEEVLDVLRLKPCESAATGTLEQIHSPTREQVLSLALIQRSLLTMQAPLGTPSRFPDERPRRVQFDLEARRPAPMVIVPITRPTSSRFSLSRATICMSRPSSWLHAVGEAEYECLDSVAIHRAITSGAAVHVALRGAFHRTRRTIEGRRGALAIAGKPGSHAQEVLSCQRTPRR